VSESISDPSSFQHSFTAAILTAAEQIKAGVSPSTSKKLKGGDKVQPLFPQTFWFLCYCWDLATLHHLLITVLKKAHQDQNKSIYINQKSRLLY